MEQAAWIDDLIEFVESELDENADVVTLSLKDLKGVASIGRLGGKIRFLIEQALRRNDIGFFPDPLPTSDTENIRLYRLGTKAAQVMIAATTLGEESDAKLRKFTKGLASSDDSVALEAIQKIRRIVDRLGR